MTHPVNCEKYKQSNPDVECSCEQCVLADKIQAHKKDWVRKMKERYIRTN